MKKRIIGFSIGLVILSISAFAFTHFSKTVINVSTNTGTENLDAKSDENKTPPYFFYDLGSRFGNTISKEKLHNTRSVTELIPDHKWSYHPLRVIQITLLDVKPEPSIQSYNDLTDAQIELIRLAEYSDNFSLHAVFNDNAKEIEKEEYDMAYYMTVVPENQAEYKGGRDAFFKYIEEQSVETVLNSGINRDKLKSGRIFFTVNTEGSVEDVILDQTSGFPSIDAKMMNLILNIQDKWKAATNADGEKVDQVLMFSFGQIGC